MKRPGIILLPALVSRAFALCLLAVCGCDLGDSLPSDPRLDASVAGKQVAFAPYQPFTVELESGGCAGFQWDCTISDPALVCLDSTTSRPCSGNWNQEGGAWIEMRHFRTLKTGYCTILLEERQGWLPQVPPRKSVRFGVVVLR